jgi:hypothetical protein
MSAVTEPSVGEPSLSAPAAPEASKTEPAAPADAGWSLPHRIGFRFAFAFFANWIFPFPFDYIPKTDKVWALYTKLWDAAIVGTGAHILHLSQPVTVVQNGSGDKLYDYVSLFFIAGLALVATVVWSLLDRRRRHYRRLHQWLRVFMRYSLAASMFGYGFAKVLPTQFPPPSTFTLTESYGESTPMHLLWTFMGFSKPYTIFSGAAECLGGFLLLFRRTTLAGALVVAAVMTNVVMLNFCYDVPVKIFSSYLLISALFLAAPDARRLASVFVLNRRAEPGSTEPLFTSRRMRWAAVAAKVLLVGSMLGFGLYYQWQNYKQSYVTGGSPLAGYYQVEASAPATAPSSAPASVAASAPALAPALAASSAPSSAPASAPAPAPAAEGSDWRTVVITQTGNMYVRRGDNSIMRLFEDWDPDAKTLTVTDPYQTTGTSDYTWTLAQPDPDHLILAGPLGDKNVHVTLHKVEPPAFTLTTRGFHWVNPFRFNR